MLIEVGGKYRARNGTVHQIDDRLHDQVCAWRDRRSGFTWCENGRFLLGEADHHLDLIEAIDNPTDALIDQTCAAFAELRKNGGRVPAGKNLEWITRDGRWAFEAAPGEYPKFAPTINYRLIPIPAPVAESPNPGMLPMYSQKIGEEFSEPKPAAESPRFKPGDRVRCVDDCEYRHMITNGKEYAVHHVETTDGITYVFTNKDHGFRENRFELVPPVPRYSIVRENGHVAIRDSQNPMIEARLREPFSIPAIDETVRRLNAGRQDYLFWTPIQPPVPRFTVSTDPCGVLDSERPGMIYKCSRPEEIAKVLNSDGEIAASQLTWQPLTRTAPLGPADIIVGVTILNNAVGHESLVLSKSASGISYCSIHAADAETDPTLYTASYEQLQRHGQYSNDHGATFQKCEKQVPA